MNNFSQFLKETAEEQDLHTELMNHYGKKQISNGHRNELKHYSRHGHENINDHLWSKGTNQARQEEATSLQKTLKRFKTPKDMTVYSSTIHDPRELKNKNDIVHHPAFLSTSIDPAQAHMRDQHETHTINGIRTHHVLVIHVPEGSNGFYMPTPHSTISRIGTKTANPYAHTDYPDEREFLIPHSSNLKYSHTTVERKKMKNDPYNPKQSHIKVRLHHHMELIND